MKELTIGQKAKLYDEIVNKLKGFMAQGVDPLITRADVQDFFPELKESEDERIRKGLIAIITDFESLSLQKNYSLSREDILAWLEKQGEQKPTNLAKGEDYGIDGLYNAIRILEKTLGKVEGYQTDDGILEHECAISAVKKLYEQKSAEWSGTDIMYLENLIAMVDAKEYPEYIKWLISIRDRVQPQPKQEWSKEDEENFARVDYACLKVYGGDSYSSDWLRKILGIHKKWKPSENDILLLERIKDGRSNPKDFQASLKVLIEQLKKL